MYWETASGSSALQNFIFEVKDLTADEHKSICVNLRLSVVNKQLPIPPVFCIFLLQGERRSPLQLLLAPLGFLSSAQATMLY